MDSPQREGPLHVLLTLLLLGVALILFGWSSRDSWEFWNSLDFNSQLFDDFENRYAWMAERIFEDPRPVPGFLYSPFFAIGLGAWNEVSGSNFDHHWLIFSCTSTVLLFLLPLRLVKPRTNALRLAYYAAFLCSLPVVHNYFWGQVSTALTLLLFASLFAYQRGHRMTAALCVGLAAAIKFYPGLFALLFLLRGDVRTALYTLGFTVLFALGVPAAVLGPEVTVDFYRAIFDLIERAEQAGGGWADAPNKQYLPAVFMRLFGGGDWALRGWQLLALALAAVSGWLIERSSESTNRAGTNLTAALLLLSFPLVVSPSWPHYFVFLPFCQLVLAERCLASSPKRPIAIALIAASVFLSSLVLFRLVDDSERYGGLGFLLFADLTLLALAWRESRHVDPVPAEHAA